MHLSSKILHLVPVFGRSSETFVAQRVHESSKDFQQVSVVTTKLEPFYNANSSIEVNRIFGRYANRLNQALFKVADKITGNYHSFSKPSLKSFIEQYRPNVVHVHFGYAVPSLASALKSIDKKYLPTSVVISLHGSDVLSFGQRNLFLYESLNLIAKFTDITLVFPSDFLKAAFSKGASEECLSVLRLEVIPNPVDEGLFCSQDELTNIEAKKNNLEFINVSRFIRWKGQKYLLEGFAKFLKRSNSEARLTLIGSGEIFEKIKALSKDLRIDQHVRFTGAISHSQVAEHLSNADAFVHTAIVDPDTGQQESFGIALLEAILKGKAVITTTTGGLNFVVGSKANRNQLAPHVQVIAPCSSEEITNAMMNIWNSGVQKSQDYISYQRSRFQLTSINKLWTKIYKFESKSELQGN